MADRQTAARQDEQAAKAAHDKEKDETLAARTKRYGDIMKNVLVRTSDDPK